jgi:hypothetical protein
MQSLATRTRAVQITILLTISLLVYLGTNWQHGIWVIISTSAVVAPYSTFLSFEKAKFRFFGTLIGLVVACGIEYYLKFNPQHLPIIAVILAFMMGFMATKSYRYLIILITVCTCMVFSYTNAPFTTLTPVSFLVDRAMGVFVGVLIFMVIQQFVFGFSNAKLELLEESHATLCKLQKILEEYRDNPSLTSAYKCAADIFTNTSDIKSYIGTARLVFGAKNIQELRYARQVLTLNNKATRLLIDEPTVRLSRINQLLHIVTVKLQREEMLARSVP